MKKRARMVLVFLGLLLALACVSLTRASQGEEYVAAAGAQSLYRLDIAQSRGTIYDCNLSPLTGSGSQYVAAVAPTIQAIGALEKATDGEYRDQLALDVEEYLKGLHHFEEILITRAGGVISSHCGPGTLGVLFYETG